MRPPGVITDHCWYSVTTLAGTPAGRVVEADHARLAPAPVAVVLAGDAIVLRPVGAGDDVDLAVGEALADGDVDRRLLVVAVLAEAVLDVALDAFQLVVEDEVDHAGDGVRAVGGRSAARHDVDPVDQVGRDVRKVGLAARAERHEAAAVQQDQGASRAQGAQVDRGGAAAAAGVALGLARSRGGLERRDFVQRLGDVDLGALLDGFGAADRDGGGGGEAARPAGACRSPRSGRRRPPRARRSSRTAACAHADEATITAAVPTVANSAMRRD